jgi:hypothetical protein
MKKRASKCVLALDESERTTERLMIRLPEIRHALRRCAGVMKKIDLMRPNIDRVYWQGVIHGWGEHIDKLTAELRLIETHLATKLSDME